MLTNHRRGDKALSQIPLGEMALQTGLGLELDVDEYVIHLHLKDPLGEMAPWTTGRYLTACLLMTC